MVDSVWLISPILLPVLSFPMSLSLICNPLLKLFSLELSFLLTAFRHARSLAATHLSMLGPRLLWVPRV